MASISPSTQELMKKYDLSARFGFGREFPLVRLPDHFQPWHDICDHLPELFKAKQLRAEIQKLPLLDHNKLQNESEWDLAAVLLANMIQGYVCQDGKDGYPETIPASIAVPFAASVDHVGVPWCYNYLTAVLANWRVPDLSAQVGHGNLESIVDIDDASDARWFFNTLRIVEFAFGPAIPAIIEAQEAVRKGDDSSLKVNIQRIHQTILNMNVELKRMSEGINADTFIATIQPIIIGWNAEALGMKDFPGLIFEGVTSDPITSETGSAGQSSTLQTLDAALGVKYEKLGGNNSKIFRPSMPIKHQQFIEFVCQGSSIKEYVLKKSDADLSKCFNECVDALANFRNYHLYLVSKYLVGPLKKIGMVHDTNEVRGAVVKNVMPWLKDLKNSTSDAHV